MCEIKGAHGVVVEGGIKIIEDNEYSGKILPISSRIQDSRELINGEEIFCDIENLAMWGKLTAGSVRHTQ